MLISATLYFTLMGIAGLLIAILTYVLFKRKGWNTKAGTTIGIILGFVVLGTMGFLMDGSVYIVQSSGKTKNYVLMGKAEHKTAKGKIIKITPNGRRLFVINEMDEELILERIIYGYGKASSEDERVPANGVLKSTEYSIDYFIQDTPPDKIETKKSGSTEKLWLRTYASFVKEYAPLMDEYEEEGTLEEEEYMEETE